MDGMGWMDGSLGLVEYRAPYGANKRLKTAIGTIAHLDTQSCELTTYIEMINIDESKICCTMTKELKEALMKMLRVQPTKLHSPMEKIHQ